MLQSTYCSEMQRKFSNDYKRVQVVNLDPAAEHFDYEALVDIREFICVDDVMDDEELNFGPNGGLVFSME